MVIEVGAKARKVGLNDEFVEELRISNLDQDIPGQAQQAEKKNSRQPEGFPHDLQTALDGGADCDDADCKYRSNGPFCEHCDCDEYVEGGEIAAAAVLKPRVPCQHGNRERRGEWQVHGRSASIADNSG